MQNLFRDIWNVLRDFLVSILDSAPLLIIALVIAIFFFWFSKMLRLRLNKYLQRNAADPLQTNFISDIFRIINVILGILLFLYIIGKHGTVTRILGAGALSAFVLGFAFKDIGENFLAGIILAFKRPFKIGDTVIIQNIEGAIIDLNLRETHIKTFDGKDVFIPNGIIIKNPLFNYTMDGFIRQQLILGLDFSADLTLAQRILLDTVNKIPGVIQEGKLAKTFVQDPSANKIHLVTQYWINTKNTAFSASQIKSQLITHAIEELTKNDIAVTS